MRIGFNGLFLRQPSTGSGQYAVHLLEALAKRDDEATYLVYAAPQGHPLATVSRRLELTGGPPGIPGSGLSKLYAEQIGFPLACRRTGTTVAHVPHFAPPFVKPCPTVVTIHDLITLLLPEYRGSLAVRVYNRLVSAAARRADAVLADSECTKRDIVRLLGVAESRVRVIYLAAQDRFCPAVQAGDTAEARERYGLPEDYILYLGGLNRHKNVGTLLAALSAARQRIPTRYTLAIAGQAHSDNPQVFPDLPAIAASLGLTVAHGRGGSAGTAARPDVLFTGYVAEEDKPALYQAASLFVFPSLYEGFGLPPLEAMASGTPVICSNAASLPEIVGDGGLLVDPTSIAGLAQAMVAVLTDGELRSRLSYRALAQARRFSWESTAARTAEVYASLAVPVSESR